jgi:hypothetical protein
MDAAEEVVTHTSLVIPSSTLKPALGATWYRTACDVHLALEITSRQVPVPVSVKDQYYTPLDQACIISGTLKRHFCKDSQEVCEWYITAQGTKDC